MTQTKVDQSTGTHEIDNQKPSKMPWGQQIKTIATKVQNYVVDTLVQDNDINEDLQEVGQILLNVKHQLQATGLEKVIGTPQEDIESTYQCFTQIYDMLQDFEMMPLENLYTQSRTDQLMQLEDSSKHLGFSAKQTQVLHQSITFLRDTLWTLQQTTIQAPAIKAIKESANIPWERNHLTPAQKDIMKAFIAQFPAILHNIDGYVDQIQRLWSQATNKKLQSYKNGENKI